MIKIKKEAVNPLPSFAQHTTRDINGMLYEVILRKWWGENSLFIVLQ